MKVEVIELWKRNPVECIRELLANTTFRDDIRYEPEQLFEDEEGLKRMFSEMWTADLWENLQVSICNWKVWPVLSAQC